MSSEPTAARAPRPGRPAWARDRYATDLTRPTIGQAWHDLWRRALVPGVGLLAVVIALGLLVVGPLGDLPAEDPVNAWFVGQRTPVLDVLTDAWSLLGSTEVIIGLCAVVIGLAWWRTGQWWFAVVPGIAVAIQAAVFMLSALLVGRDRPDAEALDEAPPTSSFPSGHTGASVAFWLSTALLVQRVHQKWLRVVLTVACCAVPVLVAYSRLYRGLHHPSDVLVGALNGAVCVWLAWYYLRRTPG